MSFRTYFAVPVALLLASLASAGESAVKSDALEAAYQQFVRGELTGTVEIDLAAKADVATKGPAAPEADNRPIKDQQWQQEALGYVRVGLKVLDELRARRPAEASEPRSGGSEKKSRRLAGLLRKGAEKLLQAEAN